MNYARKKTHFHWKPNNNSDHNGNAKKSEPTKLRSADFELRPDFRTPTQEWRLEIIGKK